MTITVFQAAKTICNMSEWSISNLKLQKLLYLANMVYLGRNNEPLVDELFEAWDYGPVLNSLYHQVKIFGDQPIRNIFGSISDVGNDSKEAKLLQEAWNNLSSLSASKLVTFTHKPNGAWSKIYNGGARGCPISNEYILEEYEAIQVGK